MTTLDALQAANVVLATDGYGRGLVPELDERIWPARGQVLATEPLAERLFDIPHYARQGFDYWHQLPDGRLVAGGFRDFSIMSELTDVEETTPIIQDALDSFLVDLLGYAPRVTHRWAGIFGLTQDFLPLVGPVPGHAGALGRRGLLGPRQRARLPLRRAGRPTRSSAGAIRCSSCSTRRACIECSV